MSALRRHVIRHGKFRAERPNARGVPNQHSRHIIAKGVCHFRKFTRLGITKIVKGMKPAELHATKGWRTVPAWS